uniref:Uncharacterized protein n=1 Tax=Amphora coffeiformis TaxID=265554 RepID=A0A7S3PD23_9STRA
MDGAYLVIGTATPNLKGEGIPEPAVAAYVHQGFEATVCKKLKNSGFAVFADVRDCSFNFVYNPVKEAAMAKEGMPAKAGGDVVLAVA